MRLTCILNGSELSNSISCAVDVRVLSLCAFSEIHVGSQVGEGIRLDDGYNGNIGVLLEDCDYGVNILRFVGGQSLF